MSSGMFVDQMIDARLPLGYGGCFYGVYPAVVTDVVDPDGQGRVRVRLPWSPDSGGQDYEAWARLATLAAGPGHGSWFIPDVDDEVLLAFEAGDPRRPYVVGMLWNGQDSPPEQMDGSGNNEIRTIRSRNGVRIRMNDAQGRESLLIETPGGQKVLLQDGPGSIKISDSNGNSVEMQASGVTVTTPAKATVQASTVEINAAMVTVNAGIAKFSGVVQADSVITNVVISSAYTPGAGNFL